MIPGPGIIYNHNPEEAVKVVIPDWHDKESLFINYVIYEHGCEFTSDF